MIHGRLIALGLAFAAALPSLPMASAPFSQPEAATLRSESLTQTLRQSGFLLETIQPLSAGSSHQAAAYQHPQTGCILIILAADPPDEAFSLAKARLRSDYWSRRFLWLGGSARPAEPAWQLHISRLWTRLIKGTSDTVPHLIVPNAVCTDGWIS
ncbi:MAG: hypothetical protein ACR2RF_04810 [Geminicoccaceae bacterium]